MCSIKCLLKYKIPLSHMLHEFIIIVFYRTAQETLMLRLIQKYKYVCGSKIVSSQRPIYIFTQVLYSSECRAFFTDI